MLNIANKLKLMLRNILVSCAEIATEEATLLYDGELAVGTEVFVEVEGEIVPAADGGYHTDEKIIVVADGKVVEIKEVETETEPEVEPEEVEVAAEEIEPAADPVEEPEAEEAEITVEDRIAALEARIGDIAAGLETILNGIAALEGRIAEVEAKVAKVEETPAEEPIDEQVVEEQAHTRAAYLRKQ